MVTFSFSVIWIIRRYLKSDFFSTPILKPTVRRPDPFPAIPFKGNPTEQEGESLIDTLLQGVYSP